MCYNIKGEDVNLFMTHPKKEKTLVILKPDALQRALISLVIARLENLGLKLVAIKMIRLKKEQCISHYSLQKLNPHILDKLVSFMTCSPVIVMVWQGNKGVKIVKKIVGSMEPMSSDVGTIRGDFSLDSIELADFDLRAVRNIVHCSANIKEALEEIKIFFKPEEIFNYRLVGEEILYDVNLDGIKE